jgi:G6PDH family F420-dependent oxidoreductase
MLHFGFDLDGGWLSPKQHIESVRAAETLGYESVWIGDHFLPWFHTDAQAPAIWPWLGAALASSSSIKVGPAVTVPIGGRYHPLIIAQQAATLSSLFPGRFLLGVGTGQAMSEERFFGRWPDWKERGERLEEAIQLMRRFWEAEDYFDWEGKYFGMSKLYLYTRPSDKIEIYVSARGKRSAELAGRLGNHFMTTVGDPELVKRTLIPAFENAMRKTGRDPRKASRIGWVEFAIGDVDALVKMLQNGPAAQGFIEAARKEMDPRKIQALGAQASPLELIKHHNLVRASKELIPVAQGLIDAGCNYIMFSDMSRKPKEAMAAIKKEVVPHLKEN